MHDPQIHTYRIAARIKWIKFMLLKLNLKKNKILEDCGIIELSLYRNKLYECVRHRNVTSW